MCVGAENKTDCSSFTKLDSALSEGVGEEEMSARREALRPAAPVGLWYL